jgi:hypothetical protein
MKTKIFLMISSLVMFTFFSCTKDSGIIDQATVNLADDEAVSDAVFEDIFNTVDNASIILDGIKGDAVKSATIVQDR